MDGRSFSTAAYEAGLGMNVAMLGSAPEVLGAAVLERSKRLARFLQKALPGLKRTQALEAVATAVGFEHWHALNSTAQRLVEDFDTEKHWPRDPSARSRTAILAGAVPLLVQVAEGVPPEEQATKCLSQFAGKLGKALGKDADSMLDVLARMSGADNWRELSRRDPVQASGPMYGFRIADDGDGEFLISAAASRLLTDLGSRLSGEAKGEDRDAELNYLRSLTEKRPDLLEGHLYYADMLAEDEDERRQGMAGDAFLAGIEQAELLMPRAFKGKLSWYWHGNRCYLRLLNGRMEWCAMNSRLKEAAALARKLLRLCPTDNMGVRFDLPAMLLGANQIAGAVTAAKGLGDGPDADLIRAMVCFAQGRLEDSKRLLLQSLFAFPMVRGIVLSDPTLVDKDDSRGVIPDAPTLYRQFCTAAKWPGLVATMQRWVSAREVIEAEKRLRASWLGFWGRHDLTLDARGERFETWREDCEKTARALAIRT